MYRLEPGMFLHLERAAGTQLRVLSGQVWITESGQPDDVFWFAGQAYDVIGAGRVLVESLVALGSVTLIDSHGPAFVKTRHPSKNTALALR